MRRTYEIIKHSMKVVKQNGIRSLLVMLGIILSSLVYTSGILISSYFIDKDYLGYKNFPENTMLVMSTFNAITEGYLSNYNETQSTVVLEHEVPINNLVNSDRLLNTRIYGVTENYLYFPLKSHDTNDSLEVTKLIAGRDFDFNDYFETKKTIHIHQAYAELLFGTGNALGKVLTIGSKGYIIVGILKDTPDVLRNVKNLSTSSLVIYMPNTTFLSFYSDHNMKSHGIIRFDGVDISSIKESNLITKDSITNRMSADRNSSKQFIELVTIGITIVSVMIIMITMFFNIKERVFEIGIRRAVGATKDDIRFQFLLEGTIYGFVGSIIGILLGQLFGFIICVIDMANTNIFMYQINLSSFVYPFTLSVVSVMAASIIPSVVASNTNIIECLKVE